MFRLAAAALLCLASLDAPAMARPAGPQDAAPRAQAAWVKSCNHYANRARFKRRDAQVEFVTVLADGCEQALEAARDGARRAQAEAAARFLDRLGAAREAIAAMNAARIASAEARATQPRFARVVRDLSRHYRLVTPSGEYLILRAGGVFDALGAWVASGAEFALIAALPD